MKDVKGKQETAWNALFGCALLGILVAGGFLLLPLSPSARNDDERKIVSATNSVKQRIRENSVEARSRTWDISAEALGSHALEEMTKLVEANHLQFSGLVAEKQKDVAHLAEVPFVLHCDGPFPNVATLIRKLEAPGSRYIVNMVQLNASGTGGDQVSATIAFLGFLHGGAG